MGAAVVIEGYAKGKGSKELYEMSIDGDCGTFYSRLIDGTDDVDEKIIFKKFNINTVEMYIESTYDETKEIWDYKFTVSGGFPEKVFAKMVKLYPEVEIWGNFEQDCGDYYGDYCFDKRCSNVNYYDDEDDE